LDRAGHCRATLLPRRLCNQKSNSSENWSKRFGYSSRHRRIYPRVIFQVFFWTYLKLKIYILKFLFNLSKIFYFETKLRFLNKISIFQKFSISKQISIFQKIFISEQNFDLLKIFYLGIKFRFLNKILIFEYNLISGQNLDFWGKIDFGRFRFFKKYLISDQNFPIFSIQFTIFYQNFHYLPKTSIITVFDKKFLIKLSISTETSIFDQNLKKKYFLTKIYGFD